jgi:anti-anti-sigma regulatory factor
VHGLHEQAEPNTLVLVLARSITPADIEALCDRVRALLEANVSDRVVFDLSALLESDAATLDMLARVQLTARRLGRQVLLRNVCADLENLLTVMGLRDVLPAESREHAEQREQSLRVEEEGDPGDPVA